MRKRQAFTSKTLLADPDLAQRVTASHQKAVVEAKAPSATTSRSSHAIDDITWTPLGDVQEVAHIDLLPPNPAGLPRIREMVLPGPRREKEKRGGATALAFTIRYLIRYPLLEPLAALFPKKRTGRPTPPARYWLFYLALARELRSFEQADQELFTHWDIVRAEFDALGICLPAAKNPNNRHDSTNPVPGYAGFQTWRKRIKEEDLLSEMLRLFVLSSLLLAQAIRDAEDRTTGDPLAPSYGEIMSGDASVFRSASGVFEMDQTIGGQTHRVAVGSRADPRGPRPGTTRGVPRVTDQGGRHGAVKTHGPKDGFYHLALSTKGDASYTRVVLAVGVAQAHEAESPAVTPLIHQVLEAAPGYFQALTYDGQMTPVHALSLMKRHGVVLVNQNAVTAKDGVGETGDAGVTDRTFGAHRGRRVNTHAAHVNTLDHYAPDGTPCVHHLISDDGAIYEADRAPGTGTPRKTGPMIEPTALTRARGANGRFEMKLIYSVPCDLGNLTHTATLTDSHADENGRVSWKSTIALHRVIPEAWTERYRATFGARNQSESFFSWLEQRYTHKDRVAAYEYDDQLLDLLGAALLHNAEAWAHYAYRHGKRLTSMQTPSHSH